MDKDETIKQRIVDYAKWDRRMNPSNITVEVDKGNVLIGGKVNTFREYKLLSEYAHMGSGAKSVKSNILVSYAIPQPDDSEICKMVQTAINWDDYLAGNKITVTSLKGVTTLTGSVDALWKKELAEDRASKIVGVKDLGNELGIVHSQSVSDEVLSKTLIAAMKANSYIDITKINVSVKNGNVDLSGTTRSFMEMQEVYRAALYAPGVSSINNNIKIEA